jgi:biopolymer transport protein TolR
LRNFQRHPRVEYVMSTTPGSGHQTGEINMTPMIDVLLVLIIIFMVITPLAPTGLATLLPQPPPTDQVDPVRPRDIVVTVDRDGKILLSGESVELASLPDRLARLIRACGDNVMFVRGDGDLEFRQVAEVIDVAKGAGFQRVALMTR